MSEPTNGEVADPKSGAKPRLIVMGRQGAGKGTQCERLAAHYDVAHLSTGDVLRAAVEAGTPLGVEAQRYMGAGDLLPDELVTEIVEERLADAGLSAGFLLDGFPRTIVQAEALREFCGPQGVDACVNLEVPLDEVKSRMLERGRDDDTEEAIERRLELYESETAPLLAYFDQQSLLVRVDGVGEIGDITKRLVAAIDSRMSVRQDL